MKTCAGCGQEMEGPGMFCGPTCGPEMSRIRKFEVPGSSSNIECPPPVNPNYPPPMESSPNASKGGCFIATAAYGDYDAPEVRFLRAFRDEDLSNTSIGRSFIQFYYKISPPIAKLIERSTTRRKLVSKFLINPIIKILKYSRPTSTHSNKR